MMATRCDVGCEFEDPENALQMGFRGQKSDINFCWGRGYRVMLAVYSHPWSCIPVLVSDFLNYHISSCTLFIKGFFPNLLRICDLEGFFL